MEHLDFERIHQRLVDIADSPLMIFLNKNENIYWKSKITKLMFKSHHILSQKCFNFKDWSNKLIFFQNLDNLLSHLELKSKQY